MCIDILEPIHTVDCVERKKGKIVDESFEEEFDMLKKRKK